MLYRVLTSVVLTSAFGMGACTFDSEDDGPRSSAELPAETAEVELEKTFEAANKTLEATKSKEASLSEYEKAKTVKNKPQAKVKKASSAAYRPGKEIEENHSLLKKRQKIKDGTRAVKIDDSSQKKGKTKSLDLKGRPEKGKAKASMLSDGVITLVSFDSEGAVTTWLDL
mgnify:FL=1